MGESLCNYFLLCRIHIYIFETQEEITIIMMEPNRRTEIKGWNGIYRMSRKYERIIPGRWGRMSIRIRGIRVVRNPEAPPQTSETEQPRTTNPQRYENRIGQPWNREIHPGSAQGSRKPHYAITKPVIRGQNNPMNRKIRIAD